ncbi:MAG: 50S ribosomal protein L23, partial [Chloroflexi bacterium]|nr:50S ribosomal protein L23 [Chloroflexota bacterium]
MLDVLAILRKPVVTEKSTLLQEQNKYVFEVLLQATKPQVKEAVERAFAVKVLALRMMRRKGELRRV